MGGEVVSAEQQGAEEEEGLYVATEALHVAGGGGGVGVSCGVVGGVGGVGVGGVGEG